MNLWTINWLILGIYCGSLIFETFLSRFYTLGFLAPKIAEIRFYWQIAFFWGRHTLFCLFTERRKKNRISPKTTGKQFQQLHLFLIFLLRFLVFILFFFRAERLFHIRTAGTGGRSGQGGPRVALAFAIDTTHNFPLKKVKCKNKRTTKANEPNQKSRRDG